MCNWQSRFGATVSYGYLASKFECSAIWALSFIQALRSNFHDFVWTLARHAFEPLVRRPSTCFARLVDGLSRKALSDQPNDPRIPLTYHLRMLLKCGPIVEMVSTLGTYSLVVLESLV